jgi:uncharacterized protein (DUF2235 family)
VKRIVICCDGTWNSKDQQFSTNVVKLFRAVLLTSPSGVQQRPYYLNGVGTNSLIEKLPGGIFGSGLWQNVQKAYRYLAESYEDGDEIYVFGFSRGAYTARSLVGMVRKCGILRRDELARIDEAYDFYRKRDVKPSDAAAKQFRERYAVPITDGPLVGDRFVPRVTFIGVWDTVGSLGIPLGFLGKIFNRKHRFHDVSLSRIVDNAYHALAIDEKRKPFRPTLWERHPAATKQNLEQHWFAGVHTNIGGGNADARQSDRCLRWMMAKARDCGLAVDPAGIGDDPQGTSPIVSSLFHDIARHVPFNLLTYTRPIGEGVPLREANYLGGLSQETVDPAVVDRNLRDDAYMPVNLLAYFRARPEILAAMQPGVMSREVW